MFIVQVTDHLHVLQELCYIGCDRSVAEIKFFGACETSVSDWDKYSGNRQLLDTLLDEGLFKWGKGVVMLIDTDGFTSDDAIRDELTKQPAGDMTVAEIAQDGELALKEGMTVDEILELCGNNLDACESHEIQGQILFKGSDGKWYTITTESIIGEATTQFVQETLVEIDQHGNGN